MSRLKRHYYSLFDAANVYDCTMEDLAHFAEVGELTLSIKVELSDVGTVHTLRYTDFDSEQYAKIVYAEGLFDLYTYDASRIVSFPSQEIGITHIISNARSKLVVRNFNTTPQIYIEDYPAYISVPEIEYSKKEVAMYSCPPSEFRIYATLDTVLIRGDELDRFFFADDNAVDGKIKELPKELSCAVAVHKEFWEDRPQDKNPTREEDINAFIKGQMGGDVTEAALDRIRTISRPEKERKGGAHSSERETYKGKSKENT